MLTFNKKYFGFAVVLFIVEVCIALYINDRIIRPYIGDVLVVILLYCAVKTFFNLAPFKVAAGVLLFAFLIEVLQYFKIVKLLGLQHNKLANTVIGNSFAWADIVAYIAGILIVLWLERASLSKKAEPHK
jgi:hypothetical protein